MKTGLRNNTSMARHLALYGLIFAATFFTVHVAGWRECTTIISATLPTPEANWNGTALRAGAYLVVYFTALILTPTCLGAAVLDWAWSRYRSSNRLGKS